ncbi:MAG: hypothetical protein IPK88_16865 [Saprospiraceae bacterium]|nr:hypothetical protein [Candidatus Defluviibacterium haderslevense]
MEINEKQFIAGFNSGYLLTKYELDLLNSILKNINHVNSYISGMTYGQKEYKLDFDSEKLKDLKQLRITNRDERSL